jgi:CDP-glucose 4,6-dehydratase
MERWKATVENQLGSIFNSKYADKVILVTGHTGFKGSWLTLLLSALGAKVSGISSENSKNTQHYESLNLDIPSYLFDISDQDRLSQTFKEVNPDIVFHLAAQPLVRYSYAFPSETWKTNVLGTHNLLEILRTTNKRIPALIITSDKCYKNENIKNIFKEVDPLGGDDPYSASKAAVEILVTSYEKSFLKADLNRGPIATARAGNIIGGGDWSDDRLIPDIIRASTRGSSLVLRNPKSTRPWMYILDVLTGYLKLMSSLLEEGDKFSGSWNFGPDTLEQVSVGDIAKLWGMDYLTLPEDTGKFSEKSYLMLDSSKSRELLNWKPILNISESINLTKSWYSDYYAGNSQQTVNEIVRYMNVLVERESKL